MTNESATSSFELKLKLSPPRQAMVKAALAQLCGCQLAAPISAPNFLGRLAAALGIAFFTSFLGQVLPWPAVIIASSLIISAVLVLVRRIPRGVVGLLCSVPKQQPKILYLAVAVELAAAGLLIANASAGLASAAQEQRVLDNRRAQAERERDERARRNSEAVSAAVQSISQLEQDCSGTGSNVDQCFQELRALHSSLREYGNTPNGRDALARLGALASTIGVQHVEQALQSAMASSQDETRAKLLSSVELLNDYIALSGSPAPFEALRRAIGTAAGDTLASQLRDRLELAEREFGSGNLEEAARLVDELSQMIHLYEPLNPDSLVYQQLLGRFTPLVESTRAISQARRTYQTAADQFSEAQALMESADTRTAERRANEVITTLGRIPEESRQFVAYDDLHDEASLLRARAIVAQANEFFTEAEQAIDADNYVEGDELLQNAENTLGRAPESLGRSSGSRELLSRVERRRSRIERHVRRQREETERARAYRAFCGPRPERSGWDNGFREAERLLSRSAHDPGSIDVENCSPPTLTSENCWETTCQVRGRNAFGAQVLNYYTFHMTTDEHSRPSLIEVAE
ncbi:MAG: hypothetical protein KC561_07625 [Myxococcales bacterium]|nr:hypothetical protein [Myxococcales bacterium]